MKRSGFVGACSVSKSSPATDFTCSVQPPWQAVIVMAGQELGLEPVKVFADLSNKISATRSHFDEYSSGVSKLLKLKARAAVDNVVKAIPSHQATGLSADCSRSDSG